MIDTYTEHNPNAPWNQDEVKFTELEEQQQWNAELLEKIDLLKKDLKTLKDIEVMMVTFGKISLKDEKLKAEILNKY